MKTKDIIVGCRYTVLVPTSVIAIEKGISRTVNAPGAASGRAERHDLVLVQDAKTGRRFQLPSDLLKSFYKARAWA